MTRSMMRRAVLLTVALAASVCSSAPSVSAEGGLPVGEWLRNRDTARSIRIDALAPHVDYRGGTPPSLLEKCSAGNRCAFTLVVQDPSSIERVLRDLESRDWVHVPEVQPWQIHPRARIAIEWGSSEIVVLYVEDGYVWWGDRIFDPGDEKHWLATMMCTAAQDAVNRSRD